MTVSPGTPQPAASLTRAAKRKWCAAGREKVRGGASFRAQGHIGHHATPARQRTVGCRARLIRKSTGLTQPRCRVGRAASAPSSAGRGARGIGHPARGRSCGQEPAATAGPACATRMVRGIDAAETGDRPAMVAAQLKQAGGRCAWRADFYLTKAITRASRQCAAEENVHGAKHSGGGPETPPSSIGLPTPVRLFATLIGILVILSADAAVAMISMPSAKSGRRSRFSRSKRRPGPVGPAAQLAEGLKVSSGKPIPTRLKVLACCADHHVRGRLIVCAVVTFAPGVCCNRHKVGRLTYSPGHHWAVYGVILAGGRPHSNTHLTPRCGRGTRHSTNWAIGFG